MLAFAKLVLNGLWQRLHLALIAIAVILVTNASTGLYFYIKGHNSAAAQCKINSIIRERDEARRDRDNAAATSKFLKDDLDRLSGLQTEREKKDADDAANVKPIDGCVVDGAAPRSVRKQRRK